MSIKVIERGRSLLIGNMPCYLKYALKHRLKTKLLKIEKNPSVRDPICKSAACINSGVKVELK